MYNSLLQPDVRVMLEENDTQGLREFCRALHPAVVAEVLEGLPPEDVWRVLRHCDFERQAEIFGFFSLPVQENLVRSVDRQHLSDLIEAMAPDDRVDLLERLDPEVVEDLMPLIAQAERSDIRKLLSFPEDSAGSIMTTEYASLPENITVAEALDRLRQQAPDSETIYYVYILDEDRHLRGLVSLRELILARPQRQLSEIMHRDVISVRVDDDQEYVAQELARYDFLAIPVVDSQNRLVGIVTHDDVLDVVQEEATEDAHRAGGMEPLEDSYLETDLATIAWKRGIWLVILLGAASVTAAVVKSYESVAKKYVWLTFFMPLVLATGGNTGSQSAALVIRSLALGRLKEEDAWRVAARELKVGLLLGTGLMLLAFLTACLLVSPYNAMIVGLSVFVVVVLEAVNGSMLPLLIKRLGMDPAFMSNPMIASLSDLIGVVIYFTMVLLLLD
ncbi:MAG: magnesium transporter [Planctomycetes bacterium]|nr:magnesium transporter [Planctomycetota bacterium]